MTKLAGLFITFFISNFAFPVHCLALHLIEYQSASPAYKGFVRVYSISSDKSNQRWDETLQVFAEMGEPSAIESKIHPLNIEAKIAYLRSIHPEKNIPAAARLANLLSSQESPECLSWFKVVYIFKKGQVSYEFMIDYVNSLLQFEGENSESRQTALILLKRCEQRVKEDDWFRLLVLYKIFFIQVRKFKDIKLLYDYLKADKNLLSANGVTFQSAAKHSFFDVFVAGFEIDILNFPETIPSILNTLAKNLYAILLVQSDNDDFPLFEFELHPTNTPTKSHLARWAKNIVASSLHRERLVEYQGEDPKAKEFFDKASDIFLEVYVMAELRNFFTNESTTPSE